MEKIITFFRNTGGAIIALSVTGIAYAKIEPPSSIGILNDPQHTGNAAIGAMCTIASYLFTAAIIFSIVLVLITGIQYMTSGGNPEKTKSAHQKLLYLAIGIAVAILARTLPVVVGLIIKAPGATGLGAVCS
jgi:hypothetical protein